MNSATLLFLGILDYSAVIFVLGSMNGWLWARQGKASLHAFLAAFTLGFSHGVSFGAKNAQQPRAKNGSFMRRR